ncbi:hypothetical protein OA07_26795 [Aphanizomenon flos-aquae 2012/KM1/D3]|nr:hypothetical protein OA07_26795 [Aphanizomenon flos-aquae 2012/KM1/D3]
MSSCLKNPTDKAFRFFNKFSPPVNGYKKTVSLFQSHVFKREFFLFPVARSLFPLNNIISEVREERCEELINSLKVYE